MIYKTLLVLLSGVAASSTERDLTRINNEHYAETLDRIREFMPSSTLQYRVEYRPSFPGEDPRKVWSPLGLLTVGDLISRKNSAVIHSASLEGRENEFVVKYADNSAGPHTETMQTDFVMMAALNDTGLTPKVYFISRSAYVPHEIELLPDYAMSNNLQKHYEFCTASNTRVRYMIVEQVGPSLAEYFEAAAEDEVFFRSADFVRNTLVIMKKTLDLLERLHMHGIYHGDIHEGNIAFRTRIPGELKDINIEEHELVLIDLEHGGFFPSRFRQSVETRSHDHDLSLMHFSPWQLMGERRSPRDDLFRLTMFTAVWSSLFRYQTGVRGILSEELQYVSDSESPEQVERDTLVQIRVEENMFAHSTKLRSQLGAVVENPNLRPMASRIVERLEAIRHHILSCDHPDVTVSFPYIRDRLRYAINAFALA